MRALLASLVLVGCVSSTRSSVGIADVAPAPVDLCTSDQLARVSALAEQALLVERQLECLRGARCLMSALALRCVLGPLVRDLDRMGRELRASGVLQSEIVVVSLRADVERPIERMYAELWAPRASAFVVSPLGLNSRR